MSYRRDHFLETADESMLVDEIAEQLALAKEANGLEETKPFYVTAVEDLVEIIKRNGR